MKIGPFFSSLAKEFSKRAPGFLTGAGVTGMLIGAGLMIPATGKAMEHIRQATKELPCECKECKEQIVDDVKRLADHQDFRHREKFESFVKVNTVNHDSVMEFYTKREKLNWKEILKTTWKDYALPFAILALSAGCIFGGAHVAAIRYGAASTAYLLAQDELSNYVQAAKDVVGPKQEEQIREQAAVNALDPVSIDISNIPGDGPTIFREVYTGWLFRSNILDVQSALNDFAKYMRKNEGYASLAELHERLCPKEKPPEAYEDLGFCEKNTDDDCEIQTNLHDIYYRDVVFGTRTEKVAFLEYENNPIPKFMNFPNETAMAREQSRYLWR